MIHSKCIIIHFQYTVLKINALNIKNNFLFLSNLYYGLRIKSFFKIFLMYEKHFIDLDVCFLKRRRLALIFIVLKNIVLMS